MNYLILGANGLIGRQCVRICKEKNISFSGTHYSREAHGLIRFNRLDSNNNPQLFNQLKPNVIVDAIGLAGGVNFCEENPQIGRQYHVESTKKMVDWCKQAGATFVYISTDYVFDGENPPYSEEDPTNPLNLYGKLKLDAENYIRMNMENYVIARTTNVFAWDPDTKTPNFLMHLVQTLSQKDRIQIPAFLYGNPTYAGDLAAGIFDLIENRHYGLYHIVGSGKINRYDWAVKLIEMAGFKDKVLEKLETPPNGMVPRPLCSYLETKKFENASNIKLHNVEEGLQLFVNEMNTTQ